mmetsp:Transcript_3187/g.9585  ORF Transcript_3187/g.9585 Transcript_3187/m.9585 type:complete len:326 (+) Transcript_3187:1000-1977(+)
MEPAEHPLERVGVGHEERLEQRVQALVRLLPDEGRVLLRRGEGEAVEELIDPLALDGVEGVRVDGGGVVARDGLHALEDGLHLVDGHNLLADEPKVAAHLQPRGHLGRILGVYGAYIGRIGRIGRIWGVYWGAYWGVLGARARARAPWLCVCVCMWWWWRWGRLQHIGLPPGLLVRRRVDGEELVDRLLVPLQQQRRVPLAQQRQHRVGRAKSVLQHLGRQLVEFEEREARVPVGVVDGEQALRLVEGFCGHAQVLQGGAQLGRVDIAGLVAVKDLEGLADVIGHLLLGLLKLEHVLHEARKLVEVEPPVAVRVILSQHVDRLLR